MTSKRKLRRNRHQSGNSIASDTGSATKQKAPTTEKELIATINRKKGLQSESEGVGEKATEFLMEDENFEGGKASAEGFGQNGVGVSQKTGKSTSASNGGDDTLGGSGNSDAADSDDKLSLTTEELQKLVELQTEQAVAASLSKVQEELDRVTTEQQRTVDSVSLELSQTREDLKKAQAEKDRLNKVFKNVGIPLGTQENVNSNSGNSASSNGAGSGIVQRSTIFTNYLQTGGNYSPEPRGAAREFTTLHEDAPVRMVADSSTGEVYQARDEGMMRAYVAELQATGNIQHLYNDFTNQLKGHNWLRGNKSDSTAAATDKSTIPVAFLDFMSMMMRDSHTPQYIWHQFTMPITELGRGVGDTIQVPRVLNLGQSNEEEDYILDSASFSTNITEQNQPISTVSSPVSLTGYGLGRGNKAFNRPVAIPEFVTLTSAMELQQAVRNKLLITYFNFEDARIKEKYQSTARVWYNNNNATVTTDPAAIGAASDVTMNQRFLLRVHAAMADENVLHYSNGKYVLCLSNTAASQLSISLEDNKHAVSRMSLEDLFDVFRPRDIVEAGRLAQGYIGDFNGFMLFVGTTFGKGGPGSEGVQTTTFGGGAETTRSSYAFGRNAVGRAIALPMQIRAESLSFDMGLRFIWRSVEGFATIDAYNPAQDPVVIAASTPTQLAALDNGQETRVFELRTGDEPLA